MEAKERNDYMKFAKHLLLLAVIVFVMDRAIGLGLKKLYSSEKAGLTSVATDAIERTTAPVLIFGSSRASHHYVSNLFRDSLQATCLNTGRDGKNILYCNAMLSVILKRYTPKIIILDLNPKEYATPRNQKDYENNASALLPYANDHPDIYSVIDLADEKEYYKSNASKIYAYNSMIVSLVQHNYLTHLGRKNNNGYLPINGEFKTKKKKKTRENITESTNVTDTNMVKALDSFVSKSLAADSKLFVIISPKFKPADDSYAISVIENVLKKYSIELWNYAADEQFMNHTEFFADETHLNNNGATLFSSIVAHRIKSLN